MMKERGTLQAEYSRLTNQYGKKNIYVAPAPALARLLK